MSAAEKATEVVAEVAEEVAEQATQVADASRGMSGKNLSLAIGGFAVGAGLGGFLGFFLSKKRLEIKYHQLAQDEIESEVSTMREHFRQRQLALQAREEKITPLKDKVEELGYVADPPLVVTPPAAVIDAAAEAAEAAKEEELVKESLREAKVSSDEVDEDEPKVQQNVFENSSEDEWDYTREYRKRSPLRPYVIHRDEREERPSYDEVTFTYYDTDDVLCNEKDEVIGAGEERNKLVGETNLNKFGHGSGDANIVYIRNDALEMQFEIVRSPNSYAEEVHGFQHSDYRRKVRRSFDDE